MARRKEYRVDLPHREVVTFDDGRTLRRGDEFTVKGEGRFKFLHLFVPDGSVTCFGPVNNQQAMIRSFGADRVGTIHRKKVGR
jgi:hypothetical protein